MNNKKIYITAILAITAANFSFAQIRTVNSDTVGNATNSSAFIDVTSNTSINGNPNLGKGLLFPQTDLSLFTTFGGAPFGLPTNYATYYDGMIVYNTKDGGKAGVGTTQGELKPGFWYYENKSKNVNGGTWKQISSPTTNQLTLTGNSLISTVNGVASNSITLPVGNNVSAINGLSKTGDNIKLGGTLTEQTTITTNGNNRLFIKGSENNAINFDDNTFSVDAENHRVGIGTNKPTQKLDVNGNVKFQNVPEVSTLVSTDKIMILGSDGTGKKISVESLAPPNEFALQNIFTNEAGNPVYYNLNSNTPSKVRNINLGLSRSVTVRPNTTVKVLINYSVPMGTHESNCSNPGSVGYLGVTFYRNGVEQKLGSRKVSINGLNSGSKMSTVSGIFTEEITNESTSNITYTYTLNGYLERQNPGTNQSCAIIYNLYNGGSNENFNWGYALMTTQTFKKNL